MEQRCPSHRPTHFQLQLNATSVMNPPVLSLDWESLARLASWWSKLLDLDACPASSSSSVSFVAQLINHNPLGFELQTKKLSWWFWGQNHQTGPASFDAQTRKPVATSFEVKLGETVDLGFEAKPRNSRSSSTCARCRPYTSSLDLLIVRPLSIRPVLNHPRSSTPGLLLLAWSSLLPVILHLSPAHHETSKHDSPHKITG
jgi:hypothetical protein